MDSPSTCHAELTDTNSEYLISSIRNIVCGKESSKSHVEYFIHQQYFHLLNVVSYHYLCFKQTK